MPDLSQESGTASSSHLGSILDVALSEYKQNTGKDLLSTQVDLRLDSVDWILVVLQNHVDALEQLRDGNRGFKLMKWISSLVHILYPISAILGDGVGLVRLRKRACLQLELTHTRTDDIVRLSHLRNQS